MKQASSRARSVAAAESPERLSDRYTVLEKLGAGGMGAVYRARDQATGRVVAYKQLLSSLAGSKRRSIEALFEREYHTLVRLKHPRIIEVYEYGLASDGPYYTMELLDGKDLQQLAPLPYRTACRHLRDIASSLALVHAHRLVHRDITPRNVRLTHDGRAKLIDFGALGAFGPGGNVVGTPMCMAPEVLHRMPLDQRTDLYALGALGYFALTGQHAYPARKVDELPRTWNRSPAPPSRLVPTIPAALDSLIMSLLSFDPLARPPSAAAVIDQLTLIAELEAEEHEQAAQSYLLSGRMVGRESELEWVRRRIARALEGKGAEVVLEGPAGIGKTRLLHELSLDAQLKGMVALKADAQATPDAFGIVATLGAQLLAACPELARRAAGPSAGLLGHLSPQLRELLEVKQLDALEEDPNERRARFQTALHEWFLDVARLRPLLVAIDNLQAADDSSAAFLAALGHEARHTQLIVLATQRSGDEVVAPAPVRALRKRSGQLRLAALHALGCDELVQSLFGDAANTGRVAKLLYEKSGGNPQQVMDLAQLLVRKQIAKYVEGAWVLPLEVAPHELPSRVEELLAARLADLSPAARELAEALSIHQKPVSIEQCLSLYEGKSERETYLALDELVVEQFLLVETGSYRFSQDALRTALLGRLDDGRRRTRHLRAAEALLATAGDSVGLRVEAAWHLLHAGEEGRGADILASAGREFLRSRGANESVEQVVQGLQAALEVYERQGRSDYEIAGLLFPLLPLAFFIDRHVTLKYGQRAVELGLKITGLGLAQRLRRLLGRKLALLCGLVVAGVGFARQKKRGLGYDLREAIGSFCGIVPSVVGTHNICYDIAGVVRLTRMLEPLALFGEGHIASVLHRYAVGQVCMGQGRESEGLAITEQVTAQFQTPAIREVLGDAHWKAMYGGLLYSLGILHPYRFGSRALEMAREMEQLGVRVWAMAADQLRMLHHALRGESEAVQRYRERVELFAVQGSTTWQAEMFWPVLLLGGDVQAGDTIATRRIWEQLVRRAEETPTLQPYAEAAHAAYLLLRGEPKEAIARYERILPQLSPREHVAWSSVRGWFADALNQAGEHARAKQVVLQTLAGATQADLAMVGRYLEPQRQLALAEAGLGQHELAASMLSELLAKHGHEDQPLLVGLLHKARAEVALAVADAPAFERHAAEMERCFRLTKNPALIAHGERINEKAVRAGLRRQSSVHEQRREAGSPHTLSADTQRALSELSGATEPREYALRLIVQETRARAGYLYAFRNNAMRLQSATVTDDPPRELELELQSRAARAELEARNENSSTVALSHVQALPVPQSVPPVSVFVDSVPPELQTSEYELLLLTTRHEGQALVVGGVILKLDRQHPIRLDSAFLQAIARTLHDQPGTTLS